jgi:hypothetical protein
MWRGFRVSCLIVLPLVAIMSYSLFAGALAIAIVGLWFWSLKPREDIDSDLKATPKEIEKDLMQVSVDTTVQEHEQYEEQSGIP